MNIILTLVRMFLVFRSVSDDWYGGVSMLKSRHDSKDFALREDVKHIDEQS